MPSAPAHADIIFGIPSYNEERTIAHVTRQVDRGLRNTFPSRSCLIVNVDSESEDGTVSVFRSVLTATPKLTISGGRHPRGKGANTLTLFRLAARPNAPYVATIDADVTSVTPEWSQKLLEPLVSRNRDLSIPLYTRDRFDATTTNHFAYPLVYSVLHANVRQPIGGDFALSRRLYEHLLRQDISEIVLQFGIDIFTTCHALTMDFAVEEVPIGRKLHKSGFGKMEHAFHQVATVALQTLVQLLRDHSPRSQFHKDTTALTSGVDALATPRSQHAVQDLLDRMKKQFFANRDRYRAYLGPWADAIATSLSGSRPTMSSDAWTSIMARGVHHALDEPIDRAKIPHLVEALQPAFVLRVVTFWQDVVDLEPLEVERTICGQAELFTKKLVRLRH